MTVQDFSINKNYKRLFAASLDSTFSHETREELNLYIKSSTAYPGQILYCIETDEIFKLTKDLQLSTISSSSIEIKDGTFWIDGKNSGIRLVNSISINGTIYEPNNGTIKICKTTRVSGEYNADDWIESLKYKNDALANKVQNDLNNLFIGGRNLIKNSAFTKGTSEWINANSTWTLDETNTLNGHPSAKISITGKTQNSWLGPITYNNLTDSNIHKGVTYTVSCWYYVKDKTTVDNGFDLEIKGYKSGATGASGIPNGGVSVSSKDMINEKWTKISATFTPTETYSNCCVRAHVIKNGIIWITDFKLEKGNKATDWTPAPEDTETYVDNLIADLQEQVDGKIETWSQDTDPSVDWNTDDDKTNHTGDLWYNTKETKRWSGTTWIKLEGTDTKNAEELAKSKKRIFIGTPTTPYDEGDLWVAPGIITITGLATKDELNNKADVSLIPTKVSQLNNDSNFITSEDIERDINFSVGKVTQLEAGSVPTVSIRGSYPNFVFDFGIPVGGSSTPGEASYMYYGRVSAEERGGKELPYTGITESMIKNGAAMKRVPCSTLGKTSMGKETTTTAYDYVVVAVPKSKNYTVTMDNGIGGKVQFDEEYAGANGLPIKIDNIDYLLYGVTLLSQAEAFIYID